MKFSIYLNRCVFVMFWIVMLLLNFNSSSICNNRCVQIQRKKSPLHDITKTCLYNSDPLKPHFYIIKLGFTGIYIIFLISEIGCFGYIRTVQTQINRYASEVRPGPFLLVITKTRLFKYIENFTTKKGKKFR